MNASMELGARLRDLRRRRRVSMKALARRLGVDPSFLSRVERGRAPAPVDLVRRVATELGVAAEPLLVLAGHLPEDVQAILRAQPERSIQLLRRRLGGGRTARETAARGGREA